MRKNVCRSYLFRNFYKRGSLELGKYFTDHWLGAKCSYRILPFSQTDKDSGPNEITLVTGS